MIKKKVESLIYINEFYSEDIFHVKQKSCLSVSTPKQLTFFPTGVEGIEPPPKVLETFVLPLDHTPIFFIRNKKQTPRAGFEPATLRLTAECSTAELSRITFFHFIFSLLLFALIGFGNHLFSQIVSHQVSSAVLVFTFVFDMGTCVSQERIITEIL